MPTLDERAECRRQRQLELLNTRRDPRTPPFSEAELGRLRQTLPPDDLDRLTYQTAVALQAEADILLNSALADEVAAIIQASISSPGRARLSRDRTALKQSWALSSIQEQRTTTLTRLLTRQHGELFPQQLRVHLYATQYVYVSETRLGLALDTATYLVGLGEGPHVRWTDHQDGQLRESIYKKLVRLEREGIFVYSELFDRQLRNALAHGDFEFDEDSDLVIRSSRKRYTFDDLMDAVDAISDAAAISLLLKDLL